MVLSCRSVVGANDLLMNGMVRETWGAHDALIVTDCEAVQAMYRNNHFAPSPAVASAKSINAGVDLNTGYPWYQKHGLKDSLNNGTVIAATVDAALSRSLKWRFRLGLFDDPKRQKYAQIGLDSVNTTASQALVHEAAAQGMVLLKNDNSTLPLKIGEKLAVVGSHANATRSLLSDYYGDQVCYGKPSGDPDTADGCITTIGASLIAENSLGDTRVDPGVGVEAPFPDHGASALAAVDWADSVVLCLGLQHSLEHEGMDRKDTLLPQAQIDFALRVLALGKPTTLLLVNGGILSIENILAPGQLPPPVGQCNLLNNTDLMVHPSSYNHNGDASAEDCCSACRADLKCGAFTWGSQTCYIHPQGLNWTSQSHRGFVSGVIRPGSVDFTADSLQSRGASAVVELWYPNQAGAGAVGPQLFGRTNRWGKLPVTIYRHVTPRRIL